MVTPPWDQKIDKAFFRGRDSRAERLKAVELAKDHPEHLIANISRYFFFRDKMEEYGPGVGNVPFGDFFQFKYQLSIDGTVAAYRFPFLLLSNSLVLKQDSKYYEHFYPDLTPWTHYVPVKSDLSDLVDQILWAKSHDKLVQKIIKNAQNYARNNLLPVDIFCYYARMFDEYKSLVSQPEANSMEGMERVKIDLDENCDCGSNMVVAKEEL